MMKGRECEIKIKERGIPGEKVEREREGEGEGVE